MKSKHIFAVVFGIILALHVSSHFVLAASPNDNFSAATTISGSSGQAIGNNIDATLETGEPEHADNEGGSSVWWSWTAPSNGSVSFDTFGSDFDTLLAAYTGDAVSNLARIASNDDNGDEYQSKITFNVTAGTTYRIAVDGYDGEQGNTILNWEFVNPPANDNFSAATTISSSSGQAIGNNIDATLETGEPEHAGNEGGSSVWWSWTAPSNGSVSFDTFGSDFDTLLAAYTGSAVSNLARIASNDDNGDEGQSKITFNVTAGTTYRIAVDGYGGEQGNITLNWNLTPTGINIPQGMLILLLD